MKTATITRLFAASLVCACTSEAGGDEQATQETTGDGDGDGDALACEAPDALGPHQVVFADLELDDPQRDRPLQTHLAYPASDAGAPYPLVVVSHGTTMDPQTYDYLFELLASHGFVVIGTKHHDSAEYAVATIVEACETIPEPEQGAMLAAVFGSIFEVDHPLRRPADLSNLIDHAEALSSSDPELAGLIDTSRVGAVGHSFGGFSSLMLSGASVDLSGIETACAGGPNDWLSKLLIGDALVGLICFVFDSVSDEALMNQPFDLLDDRVLAVASLAGPLELVWGPTAEGLGAVELPALMVYTDTDATVDYGGTAMAYASFAAPKSFLGLAGGTHGNFGLIDYPHFEALVAQVPDTCTYRAFVEGMVDTSEMPTLSAEDQTWLTGAAVAGFMQQHVAGASGCENYLTAAYFESLSDAVLDFL